MKLIKGILGILVLVFCSFPVFSQFTIGGGLVFGSNILNEESIGALGIHARGGYQFDESWRLMVGTAYYLEGVDDVNFFDFDLNVNFFLAKGDLFQPYALAGLNNITVGGDAVNDNSELSLNFGFGTEIVTDGPVTPFVELKGQFLTEENRQYVFAAGLIVSM